MPGMPGALEFPGLTGSDSLARLEGGSGSDPPTPVTQPSMAPIPETAPRLADRCRAVAGLSRGENGFGRTIFGGAMGEAASNAGPATAAKPRRPELGLAGGIEFGEPLPPLPALALPPAPPPLLIRAGADTGCGLLNPSPFFPPSSLPRPLGLSTRPLPLKTDSNVKPWTPVGAGFEALGELPGPGPGEGREGRDAGPAAPGLLITILTGEAFAGEALRGDPGWKVILEGKLRREFQIRMRHRTRVGRLRTANNQLKIYESATNEL